MKMTRRWLAIVLVLVTLAGLMPATATADSDEYVYVTLQGFVGGKLYWRSDTGYIWALCNNGLLYTFSPLGYSQLPDNPYVNPPAGYIRPINGFGKIWGYHKALRDQLGWATTPEVGFYARITTRGTTTYLTELDRKIVQITIDGIWQYVESIPVPPTSPQLMVTYPVPNPVNAGSTVAVGWGAQGVDLVIIELFDTADASRQPFDTLYDLPLRGTRSIVVPADIEGSLKLEVWGVARKPDPTSLPGSDLKLIRQIIEVRVEHPATETAYTQAAYQRYQRGFMLWRADTGAVMTFAGDQGGHVAIYPEHYYSAFPNNPITSVPPGLVLPVNAFGKLWGERSYIRDTFGYALGPEESYIMTIQTHAQTPEAYRLPDGRWVYVVGSNWRY